MVDPARSRTERLDALSYAQRALLTMLRTERAAAAAAGTPDGRGGSIAVLADRTGTRADPIVLVHPIGGGVFCYAELGHALSGGSPVWAIAADDVLAGGTAVTVEALAAHYVDRVATTGRTAAVVAGWSFGGLIAYEMARVLAATGRRVPPVVLLDTMSWPPHVPAWDTATTTREFVRDLLRSSGAPADPRHIDAVDWHQPTGRALAAAHTRLRAGGIAVDLDPAELAQRHRLYTNATRAMQRYRPAPHGGAVSVVVAADSGVAADEWRAVARGPLAVCAVPGDHYALVRGGVATRRAAALIAGLAAAPDTVDEGRARP